MLLKKLPLNKVQMSPTYLLREGHRHHPIETLIAWYLVAPDTIFKLVQRSYLVSERAFMRLGTKRSKYLSNGL